MKRLLSLTLLIVLLASVLASSINIRPVEASGTIYIRADGSVDPPTAPISTVDNVAYILTGNITSDADGIVVERSNIIIDGAGYTLQGSGGYLGLNLSSISNVAIKNTQIKGFTYGIYLKYSSNNIIVGNIISDNEWAGILMDGGSNNYVDENNISRNGNGINLLCAWCQISNNVISNNVITDNLDSGITLNSATDNKIIGNKVLNNGGSGTYNAGIHLLYSSSGNIVAENNASGNAGYGILVEGWEGPGGGGGPTSNNTISNNKVFNNERGISIDHARENRFRDNSIANNKFNFLINGYYAYWPSYYRASEYIQDIDASNTINGKPIYYLVNEQDKVIDYTSNAGFIGIVSSINITIEDLILENNREGVLFFNVTNSRIENVIASNNAWGISLHLSSGNDITGNNISANYDRGINLYYSSYNSLSGNVVSWNENGIYLGSSSNNTIIGNQISGNNQYGLFREGSYDDGQSNNNKVYHNNFIDNKQKPQVGGNWPYYGTGNLFDNGYPSGGNYWSDYTGIDGNGDGIGDTPYTIDVNNIDRYPLVNPWTPAPPAPDFSITASLTSLTVQQGNSDTSIITITSIGGFSQPVQLSVSGAPPGVTATLNSEQVTPPPDGSTISTLTVSVATTATLGSYTLNVTGTNGTLTHSTYISLEITSAPSIPNPPVLVSPGSSSPGEEVYTLTPTFRWNSVQSADQYGLYIRDIDSNELIFDSQVREITLTETSYTLPSGILRWGKNYRWNMNSRNEACWGGFCSPLYFYVAPEPPPDSTPPTLVEDFTASDGEDERSTLRWTNPSDSDLAEVVVLRRIEEYPESHLDGELVYRSISPSPNTEIEFFDTALVNGRIYSYAVLSRDSAGNWNDTVREGNNAATVTPSSYANQPPEPQFVYSPTDPKLTKTWKSILFDASSSSDDDEITLFEWDWDGNGIYDWSSGESKVTFVYDQSGTYQVNLRVTDSDGARDTTSKQITISEWGFWDRKFNKDYDPPDPETEITNDNYQYIKDQLYIFTLSNDLNEYWEFRDYYDSEDGLIGCILHGYCDSDLKQALSMEMDPQHSPGLTYCIHILDALREMDKVEQVWTQGYKLKASAYFSDLLDANSKWTSEFDTESLLERTKDILIGIIEDLQPNSGVLGAGVGFLGFVNDCVHAGIPVYKLARLLYYNTLWRYFDLRHSGESHASAWQEVTQVPTEDYHLPREITDNPSKLAVTESLFKRLYESYGGHFDGWYEFRREVKKDLRLLLSEVLKRVSLVGHVVVVPHSPVEIRAYDSQGNITGLVNGELVEHIPNSACDNETGMVGVLSAGEGIYYEVAGTGLGNYSLEIALVGTGICTIFVAYDIPTSLEERHKYVIDWAALALGEEGVTVQVDSDGDGAYEHTSFSDATLTGDEFAIAMGGPVVESCNSTGTVKESFDLGDSVYVKGEGYSPSATYDLYVVNATTWSDGMPIPQRVEGTATTIASDTSGNISVTPAWNAPITLGNYDIVVDVNRDGYYNSSIDALDQSNVQIKAGFQTVPEFSQITILAALMIITMSATILVRKKHYRSHHVQHSSKRGMS